MFSSSVKAEDNNYISGNNDYKITERIDSFFIKHPNKKKVFWSPEIEGKSRYAFSIPKDAYLFSKKYSDTSDLYYLSGQIDNGLKFKPNRSKGINFYVSKSNFKANFQQRLQSNIIAGVFLEKNESFGITLNKEIILTEKNLGVFGFEQSQGEPTTFKAKLITLNKNETSELFSSISHKFNSNIFDVDVRNTWFDIANQIDFTLGIKRNNSKVTSDIYASVGKKKTKFQVGLNQIKDNSSLSFFIKLKFEDIIDKKYLDSKLIISSENSITHDEYLSLKGFRRHNLDALWRKNMNF